jgi:hypothetical protein
MKLKKAGLLGLLGASFLFGCHNPIEPPVVEDTAPVVASFTATLQSTELNTPVTFNYSVSDKEGLDSLVVSYGDGSKTSVPLSRKTSYTSELPHSYTVPGTKTADIVV